MGRDVITLVHEEQDAVYHQVTWNGKSKNGDTVSSAVYFYQMETKDFIRTKKLLFLN
jgi:flagellar hook assembly protein FlgD